ncbi:MAG: AEC family transporter [Chloroflexota bacterium]|nr:AEC family transporter [Chloroflexota bacterium]
MLKTLLPIFTNTVLPVFLVAAAGFVLAGFLAIDSRSVGRLLFYLATPALVFRSLYQMQIDYTALRHLTIVAASAALLTGLLGWLISIGQERRQRAAIVLTSAVSNNGNMGIPISLFAFGEVGVAFATIYYVVSSFISNTFGVIVASAGQTPLRVALQQSLRVPVLYAASAGFLVNAVGGRLPATLFRAVDLLADAAVPGMLILMGIQLRAAPLFQAQGIVVRSVAVRLLAGPLVAWLLCTLLGVTGVERSVLILQAAMPTAVMTAVLATEYDIVPNLVASIIFFSTLCSMITLSFVLWMIL